MRLIIRDIKKKYDEVAVLNRVGYAFEPGLIYGIAGGKGAGKTTLLNCICGECVPDCGYVRLDTDGQFLKTDYMDFGIVHNEPVLPESLTGRQYVRYLINLHKPDEDNEAEYFKQAGIADELMNEYIGDYSDEEKQRLQLVSIIITSPAVILIDEPDIKGKMYAAIKEFVNNMKKSHIILIASDNYAQLEEIADEIIYLENGCLYGNKV